MFHVLARQIRQQSLSPLASVAILSLSLLSVTSCEENSVPSPPVSVNEDDDNEVDEPTSCHLCLTFRQGPCRPFWRKFEKCTKNSIENTSDGDDDDKDDDDDDDKEENELPCLEESSKFQECLWGYQAYYQLVEKKVTQDEYIDPLEAEVASTSSPLPLLWSELDVDWSDLWEYAKENDKTLDFFGATPIHWNKFLSGYIQEKDLHDFVDGCQKDNCPERYLIIGNGMEQEPFELHPTLIPIRVRVPLYDSDGTPILMCYARDQKGLLLGHSDFRKELEEGAKEHFLWVLVQPGKTLSIKIHKIFYPKDEKPRFYVSKAKFIVEAAFEAGLT